MPVTVRGVARSALLFILCVAWGESWAQSAGTGPVDVVARYFSVFDAAIRSAPAAGHAVWADAAVAGSRDWVKGTAARTAKRESLNALMYSRPRQTQFRELSRSASQALVVVDFSVGEHSAAPHKQGKRFTGLQYELVMQDGRWLIAGVDGDIRPLDDSEPAIVATAPNRVSDSQAGAAKMPAPTGVVAAARPDPIPSQGVPTKNDVPPKTGAPAINAGPMPVASAPPGDPTPAGSPLPDVSPVAVPVSELSAPELIAELTPGSLSAARKQGRISPEVVSGSLELSFVTLRQGRDIDRHASENSVCLEVPPGMHTMVARFALADFWTAQVNTAVQFYFEIVPDDRCPTWGQAALVIGEEDGLERLSMPVPNLDQSFITPPYQLGLCGETSLGNCMSGLSGGVLRLRLRSLDAEQTLKLGFRALRLYRRTLTVAGVNPSGESAVSSMESAPSMESAR